MRPELEQATTRGSDHGCTVSYTSHVETTHCMHSIFGEYVLVAAGGEIEAVMAERLNHVYQAWRTQGRTAVTANPEDDTPMSRKRTTTTTP